MGIDNRKISKWEMGDFDPSLSELRILASFFEVKVEDILYEDKEERLYEMEDLFWQEELDINTLFYEFIVIAYFINMIYLVNCFIENNLYFYLALLISIICLYIYNKIYGFIVFYLLTLEME